MDKTELNKLIKTGREIEFVYNGERYSVTYYGDGREAYISFCKFYKDPIDVKNLDELLKLPIGNSELGEILLNLNEDEIWIF